MHAHTHTHTSKRRGLRWMACFVHIIDFLPLASSLILLFFLSSSCCISFFFESFTPHSSGCFLFAQTVGRARYRNMSSSLASLHAVSALCQVCQAAVTEKIWWRCFVVKSVNPGSQSMWQSVPNKLSFIASISKQTVYHVSQLITKLSRQTPVPEGAGQCLYSH